MSLHTEIKQFLAAVKGPANLTTTRVSLEQAVGLLGRIQVDPDITGVVLDEEPSDYWGLGTGRTLFIEDLTQG